MITIGVTGGMGAGKSRVLAYLEERWGAYTLRLDDVSRRMLDIDGLCYHETVRMFGGKIVRQDGTLDRALIAAMIFEEPRLRESLNGLIHPAVKTYTVQLSDELKRQGTGLLIIEAALLIEDRYDKICDELWYVYADEETRRRRLRESRGYEDARIEATFAAQLSDGEFRAHADFVIDNSGSFETAAGAIDRRVRSLLAP